MEIKDISVLIPSWLAATHCLGAYRSVRKFYPDISIYVVSDFPTEDGGNDWHRIHNKGHDSYDPDYTKIQSLPDIAFIWNNHNGWETDGHGNAVTHAMKFIHTKWVVHLSDDVRIIKDGVVEMMLREADEKTVAVGEDFSRDWGPNVGKWLCMYRGDVYHKNDMDFHADYKNCKDAGSPYFQTMIGKGFNIKYVNLDGYYLHLGSKRDASWEKYYLFENV